ncbi:MAG: hypothetical protein WD578_02470 [Bacteroidales bacterium]
MTWKFVNVANSSGNPFSMYHDDWSPKRVMRVVDDNWDYWMEQVERIESGSVVGISDLIFSITIARLG